MAPPDNTGRQFKAQPLTPDEIAALLGGCSLRAPTGIRNRAMIWFLWRSGLRVSEITEMRLTDMDQRKHNVTVLGKGRHGRQKLTVRGYHPSADDALARWLDVRRQLPGVKNTDPVFCTLSGGQIKTQYVRNLLHRLAAKAGITKRVHPHALRHTFAVELEDAGKPVTTISKLLGHSSIAVTARYLDHLTNQQAVDSLQDADLPDLPEAS